MNNDNNDLNLHIITKLSGWLRYWVKHHNHIKNLAILSLKEKEHAYSQKKIHEQSSQKLEGGGGWIKTLACKIHDNASECF